MSTNLTKTKLCSLCDCYSLCKRIIKDNSECSITCSDIRELIIDIINKNIGDEDY